MKSRLPKGRVTPEHVTAQREWSGATVEGPILHEFVEMNYRGPWWARAEVRGHETAMAYKITKGAAVLWLRFDQDERIPAPFVVTVKGESHRRVEAATKTAAKRVLRALLQQQEGPNPRGEITHKNRRARFGWDPVRKQLITLDKGGIF